METLNEKYETLNTSEFSNAIRSDNVYILDVRHPDEFTTGHIKDAHNIDVMEPDFMTLAEKELPRNIPIAVYCGSGKRSAIASEKLSDAGFKVLNLDGGLMAWKQAGLPVT